MPVLDYLAARDIVVGVLAALLAIAARPIAPGDGGRKPVRERCSSAGAGLVQVLRDGTVQLRSGHRNESVAPAGLYRTRDGRHVAVAVLRDEHFAKLCGAASGFAEAEIEELVRSGVTPATRAAD